MIEGCLQVAYEQGEVMDAGPRAGHEPGNRRRLDVASSNSSTACPTGTKVARTTFAGHSCGAENSSPTRVRVKGRPAADR